MGDHAGNKERGLRHQLSFTWKDGNRELWQAAFERWASDQPGVRRTAQEFIVHLVGLFGEADEVPLRATEPDPAAQCHGPSGKADVALIASVKRADRLAAELAEARVEAHELKMAKLELEGNLARMAMDLEASRRKAQEQAAQMDAMKAELAGQSDLTENTAMLFRDMEIRMAEMRGEIRALKDRFLHTPDSLSAGSDSGLEEESATQGI